jgi:hypothetical protein
MLEAQQRIRRTRSGEYGGPPVGEYGRRPATRYNRLRRPVANTSNQSPRSNDVSWDRGISHVRSQTSSSPPRHMSPMVGWYPLEKVGLEISLTLSRQVSFGEYAPRITSEACISHEFLPVRRKDAALTVFLVSYWAGCQLLMNLARSLISCRLLTPTRRLGHPDTGAWLRPTSTGLHKSLHLNQPLVDSARADGAPFAASFLTMDPDPGILPHFIQVNHDDYMFELASPLCYPSRTLICRPLQS